MDNAATRPIIEDFVKVADVPEKLVAKYEGRLPEEVLDIWHDFGFGTFYDGCLKVIDPDEYQALLEESYFQGDVSIPIFATAFGDLITWEKGRFIGIVMYRYGDNDVITSKPKYFFGDLADGELDEEYLDMRRYRAAVDRLGPLAYDECFGYVPLLALGGRESVDNLKKVKTREHIALIFELAGEV